MKLNKKGYMLVEIIVSFALTFAIMIAMINLVLSFKNKNEDIYYEAKYLKDKNLITRNIMDDLSDDVVTEIYCKTLVKDDQGIKEQECSLRTIKDYIETVGAMGDEIILKTTKSNGKTTIKYIFKERTEDGLKEKYSYEKTLEPSLVVGEIKYKDEKGVFSLTIPVNSIYTDESYDIKLVTKRVYSLDMNIYIKKNGTCELGSIEEENYCKFTQGYPNETQKEIFLKAKIPSNYNESDYGDIYRFLEYNTNIDITGASSPGISVKFSNPKQIILKEDTAINLYFTLSISNNPKLEKIIMYEGNNYDIYTGDCEEETDDKCKIVYKAS